MNWQIGSNLRLLQLVDLWGSCSWAMYCCSMLWTCAINFTYIDSEWMAVHRRFVYSSKARCLLFVQENKISLNHNIVYMICFLRLCYVEWIIDLLCDQTLGIIMHVHIWHYLWIVFVHYSPFIRGISAGKHPKPPSVVSCVSHKVR